MLVWIWVRNDESGLLDDEFRDSDVDHVALDSYEPSIGTQERKSWLIVKVPDPPLFSKLQTAVEAPEYTSGPTPDATVVRRKRAYRLDWRTQFSSAEIEIITNPTMMLPDGATSGGGTVLNGIVSDLFTLSEFVRK